MIKEYRRIGTIKAVQYTGDNRQEILDFTNGIIKETDFATVLKIDGYAILLKQDVWIMKTEANTFQSVPSDVFPALFEEVKEDEL